MEEISLKDIYRPILVKECNSKVRFVDAIDMLTKKTVNPKSGIL